MFNRLTREHNPDDPLEAKRLTDAGARLDRARDGREVTRLGGEEEGPMRVYPGGLATSRAVGDFDSPAVICEVRSIHWSPYDRVGVVNADP